MVSNYFIETPLEHAGSHNEPFLAKALSLRFKISLSPRVFESAGSDDTPGKALERDTCQI